MPVTVAPEPAVKPVRWGILGVANIAVQQVIPALQRGAYSEVVAIASRAVSYTHLTLPTNREV